MSQIDYASMTLDEAKRYFLQHRDDQEAFYAYMDKLHASGRAIVIDPTDPESEAKAIAAIQQKLSIDTQLGISAIALMPKIPDSDDRSHTN